LDVAKGKNLEDPWLYCGCSKSGKDSHMKKTGKPGMLIKDIYGEASCVEASGRRKSMCEWNAAGASPPTNNPKGVLTFCVPNAATRAQGDGGGGDSAPPPRVDDEPSPAEIPPPVAGGDEPSPAEVPSPPTDANEGVDPCSRPDPMKKGKRKSQVCCKAQGFGGICLDKCRGQARAVLTNTDIAPKARRKALGDCQKLMAKQKGTPRFRSNIDRGRVVAAKVTAQEITPPRLDGTPSPADMSADETIAQAEAVENAIGVQMAMDFSDV
jgi:hypothetical protein